MPIRIVQSKQNARLKELHRALTHPMRDNEGIVGIEGPNLLTEVLRAGLRIHSIFLPQGDEDMLNQFALPSETEILLTPAEILRTALVTETPQPIAALIEPPTWTWEKLTQKNTTPLLVLLAGLQDPGNLGTILRAAEAFGATGVISLPGTVGVWNPKTVRASAGSIFRMPFLHSSVEDCFKHLRKSEITILTTSTQNAEAIHRVNLKAPTALLIGNEGKGVPPEIAVKATKAVTIPCPGPVESLNAAVATAILLYEASRQRGART